MNGAVRAVVRMGIYVGAKVYFIHEVRRATVDIASSPNGPLPSQLCHHSNLVFGSKCQHVTRGPSRTVVEQQRFYV